MADEKYLGSERVRELWTAVKTQLALKADLTALEDYSTPDAVALAIATALTDYAKDSDVQSAITAALADYMKESDVNDAIAKAVGNLAGLTYKTEDSLPDSGEANIIYLVPAENTGDKNAKDEYLWIDGAWEKIGSTSVYLADYWSKTELQEMSSEELQVILQ